MLAVWGPEQFSWEVCEEAVLAATHYSEILMPVEEQIWTGGIEKYRTHTMAWARSRFQKRKEVSLHWLLKEFWDHEASDPRDKVYALLGLVVGILREPLSLIM